MQQNIWFTPDGIEDLLPSQAEKLELYRHKLLNKLKTFGYQQVLPPIAEFTDSLLTGTGYKLALDTSRFTDYESGRMMGVRADMTPQVARLVSNRIKPKNLARLCYVGEVLKSRNNKAQGSRSPIQLGAELFGSNQVESDLEIIDLMVQCASTLNLPNLKISLGHVGLIQKLMDLAGLNAQQKEQLVSIFKRKALPEYQAWLASQKIDASLQAIFQKMPDLAGNAPEVLAQAKTVLAGQDECLANCLTDLEQTVEFITQQLNLPVHLDLMDLRGFGYHTGMIFSCYSYQNSAVLIAKGGRYDEVCSAFGEDYPATGFSMDLRNLLDAMPELAEAEIKTVYAPFAQDANLYQKIKELREAGIKVIRTNSEQELNSSKEVLQLINGTWQLAN